MSRKVVIFVTCGPGSKEASAWNIPEGVSDDKLSKHAWQLAEEHASSYGVYPPDDEDDYEPLHGYSWDDVDGYWVPYDSEKHDGLLLYGTNTQVKFQDY